MEQHAPSQAREIFNRALEIEAPADRDAYLAQICGGDAELRHNVDALLRAHDAAGSFLESPACGSWAARTTLADRPAPPIHERPGTMVGPYRLIEQIGEGGMGVVFRAEQTRPVRRQVAVKVIKAGMDTRQVVARFDAERQALALMDHPNIARVFDAGVTDTGRPFFVMELVNGAPITRYCDDHRLTPRDRLALFVQVCHGVQHAHQKGVIHRDLKPSNVLVAPADDGRPVPKVIDFGVAKATGPRLTEQTLFTGLGDVVGTPQYMSPEQAELNQPDVDTRSDVYSLGVLLYELLTGTTPIEHGRTKEAALLEVLRVIREEDPPRPSTRLGAVAELPSIAANRGLEPRKLSGLMHGDLDCIVMKALEKDRARRYETANGFARDVERYLDDEPVQARPPSAAYRFRKFVRRNKVAVAAGVAVVVALAGGLTMASVGLVKADQARTAAEQSAARANTEAAKATAVSEVLQQMLQSANPEAAKGTEYTVGQLLDDFSARLGGQLQSQPAVEAEVRATIGRAYRVLGAADAARPHLERVMALQRRLHGERHEAYARSLVEFAWMPTNWHYRVSDHAAAEPYNREALRIYRQLGTRGKPLIYALRGLQLIQNGMARYDDAVATAQEALAAARDAGETESGDVASVLHELAFSKLSQRKYAEAEQWARQSVDLHRKVHGAGHVETAWGLVHLGRALHRQKRLADAEAAFREALAVFCRASGPAHMNVDMTTSYLARVLDDQGRSDAQTLIDMLPREPGLYNNIAWRLATSARPFPNPQRAVELAKQAVDMVRGESVYWNTLGAAHYRAGDWPAAVAALEKAIYYGNGGNGFDFFQMAMAHWRAGNKEQSRTWYDRGVQWMDARVRQGRPIPGGIEQLRRFREDAEVLILNKPRPQPATRSSAATGPAK